MKKLLKIGRLKVPIKCLQGEIVPFWRRLMVFAFNKTEQDLDASENNK
jgi:hypothetical protein